MTFPTTGSPAAVACPAVHFAFTHSRLALLRLVALESGGSRTMPTLALAAIIGCALGAPPPHSPQVVALEIRSTWSGLGAFNSPRPQTHLIGHCAGTNCHVDGRPVPRELFQALLDALLQPPVPVLSLDGLGVTDAWLHEFAVATDEAYRSRPSKLARNELDTLFVLFHDRGLIEGILRDYYSHTRTDDYPGIVGTVTLSDGSQITFGSGGQQALMLPWTVTLPGGRHPTFDSRISTALLALLPAHFLNAGRLSIDGLKNTLDAAVWRQVHCDCRPHKEQTDEPCR